jgi:HK97 family phage major capsid protein
MADGEFLVGNFAAGAMGWDRQQTTVGIAEQHEDFYVRNMVAILAEKRIALTVFRPDAFVKGLLKGAGLTT